LGPEISLVAGSPEFLEVSSCWTEQWNCSKYLSYFVKCIDDLLWDIGLFLCLQTRQCISTLSIPVTQPSVMGDTHLYFAGMSPQTVQI